MSTNTRAWILGFWMAFLAAGTWILPGIELIATSGSVAYAVPTPHVTLPDNEADIVADLNIWFAEFIADAALDTPPSIHSQFDLTGDGVSDEILIDPGDLLLADGRIVVVDGLLHETLYELASPPDELGFAEHVGLWPDCDMDGNRELVIHSGYTVDGVGGQVQGVLRIHSGANGELLAVILQGDPQAEVIDDEVLIAGDRNGDKAIDAADVCLAGCDVGQPCHAGQCDFDIDGMTTAGDVASVVSKAMQDAQPQRTALLSTRIAEINATGEQFTQLAPMMLPSSWVGGWTCWQDLAMLGARVIGLLVSLAVCAAGTLTGPAVIACWVAVACQLVALLTAILSFLTTCYLSVPMPIVTLGLNAITALADLCTLGAGIVGAFAEAVKGALRILRMFQGL